MVFKREIRPGQYAVAIERDKFSEDPRAKQLTIALPMEGDVYVFALSEEQKIILHDGTAPSGIVTAQPSEIPPPPEGV